MMIQKYLIQYVLSPLGGIMEKLSQRMRDFLFVLAGLCVILQIFLRDMSLVKYRFLIFFTVDCLFLGIMILSTLHKNMKPVKFRWPIMGCWIAVGLGMLLSGVINNVDYLPEAVLFLVVYPICFVCWNNCDHSRIFKLLLRMCRISLVIFVVASFMLTPIQEERYPGIFNNTNGAAYYLAVCMVCQIVELAYDEKFGLKTIWNVVLLGLAGAMMYYTNSRTGPLSVVVALLGGVCVYLLTHTWKHNLKCLVRMILAGVVTVIITLNLVYVFQLRPNIELPYYYNPESGQFYKIEKVVEPDVPFDTSGFQTVTNDKSSVENKTLDQYSTGRISIWTAYAKDLNWTGHAQTPQVYVEWLYKYISTTHMTILEIAYESGIPAGVFYLLMNIGTGLVSIWYAWKYRKERYAAMPLMITLAFGIMSMLGSCGVSLWYLTTLYYYFVQFPIVAKKPQDEQDLLNEV